ncbi:MAG: DUF1761 domain-containing protein [Bacteroidia bacterium]|nr:DUF1761 domain-containing protein [Bacteroidia bacterium]NNC85431.1 DUF1761 domain-containing protein [Bacteroidia bacterium]NNM15352.1 DUF1761 domain-containing protein [Bacteroidia bacterium]
MENVNFLAVVVAALVPMVFGFLWYNPKLFGNAWMEAAGMTEEKVQGGNMAVIFGVSLLLSFLLAMSLMPMVNHQMHLGSLILGDDSAETAEWLKNAMATYGDNYRTFGHGAFHGVFAGLMFVLPVLGTNALFERKGFKYILVNVGYWTVTLAAMGAIICGWQ